MWKNGKNFLEKGVALDGTIKRGDSMGGIFFGGGFQPGKTLCVFL